MPSTPALDKIKAKRIQAEQKAQELRDAEINAAFEENPITDPDYEFKCRIRSKQRQRTHRVRHNLGRKQYSIRVQAKKLDQLRSDEKELISMLNKVEQALAKTEQDLYERREVAYQAFGECQQ